jgi:hypothetical protein
MPYISKKKIKHVIDAFTACVASNQSPDEESSDEVLNMLQGLLDQPAGEPVAWMTSVGRLCSTETTNLEQGLMYGWQPLYPHPAPFTPITADDVTDEMVDAYIRQRHSFKDHEVVIAAAVNAYIDGR